MFLCVNLHTLTQQNCSLVTQHKRGVHHSFYIIIYLQFQLYIIVGIMERHKMCTMYMSEQ